jgi:hypothetical protein
LAKQAEVKEMLKVMEEVGMIKESDIPRSSLVVPVRKTNADLCFCLDDRKINEVTKKDCLPETSIDDMLDTLTAAKRFSLLDMKSCCWKVALNSDNEEQTAFSTDHGL